MKRLFEVGSAFGAPVSVHWSAMVLAALMTLGTIRRPAFALAVVFSFAALMFIHELGHTLVAQHFGLEVLSIELYPIHGITRHQEPWTHYDDCLIAWGGCVAQMVVAFPLIIWVLSFGYSSHEPVNAVFAILGYFSAFTALVNLLPVAPLDGSRAWALIPMAIQRWRRRFRSQRTQAKPGPGFRVYK